MAYTDQILKLLIQNEFITDTKDVKRINPPLLVNDVISTSKQSNSEKRNDLCLIWRWRTLKDVLDT
jgi:hypothetical protein